MNRANRNMPIPLMTMSGLIGAPSNSISDNRSSYDPIWRTVLGSLAVVGVYLVWSITRSLLVEQGTGDPPIGPDRIPFEKSFLFLVPMVLIAVAVMRNRGDGVYFLVATSVLMIPPVLPHLPFIREYEHLVIWVFIISHAFFWYRSYARNGFGFARIRDIDPVAIWMGLFLIQGVVSLLLNQAMSPSLLTAKLGLSELLMYGSFVVMLTWFTELTRSHLMTYRPIFLGLVFAASTAVVLGVLGCVAIYLNGVVPGNDTAFGFGYWDRLKATFSGPNHAGIFYAAAIAVFLHFGTMAGTARRAAYLWALVALAAIAVLIIATGSRSARLTALLPLAVGLIYRPYRRMTLIVLPVYAAAYYWGFHFRSLNAVFNVYMGDGGLAYQNIKQYFWNDPERLRQVNEAVVLMLESSVLQLWLGFGPGVGGYAQLNYPSPHLTVLDIVVEQGLIGLFLASLAVLSILRRLVATVWSGKDDVQSAAVAVSSSLLVLVAGEFVHANQSWGFLWCFFFCAAVIAVQTRVPFVHNVVAPAAKALRLT